MSIRRIVNIAVSVLCALVLMGVTAFIIVRWSQIPDRIPINYGADGSVTDYEDKSSLFILLGINWAAFVLLTWIGFRPLEKGGALRFARLRFGVGRGSADFVKRAFENNPAAANNVAIDMTLSVKVYMVALLSFVMLWSIGGKALAPWFFPLMMAILFVLLMLHVIRLWRIAP